MLVLTQHPWNCLSSSSTVYYCKKVHTLAPLTLRTSTLTRPCPSLNMFESKILYIPNKFVNKYKLTGLDRDGWICFEIHQGCYGLPQAGILANNHIHSCLKAKGFYEAASTPGLWCHKWRQIKFCLIVDNFGVKYMGLEHFNYLLGILKKFHGILAMNLLTWTLNGTTLPTTAASVCQAISLCCFSNSSIHTQPNHGYLLINVSLLPTAPSRTSHLILTPQNFSMLAANAASKKLWGHCSTTHRRLITNYSLCSAPLLPEEIRP
jgi:hypothetical protein